MSVVCLPIQRLCKDVSSHVVCRQVLKFDGTKPLLVPHVMVAQGKVSRAGVEVLRLAQRYGRQVVLPDHGRFKFCTMPELI